MALVRSGVPLRGPDGGAHVNLKWRLIGHVTVGPALVRRAFAGQLKQIRRDPDAALEAALRERPECDRNALPEGDARPMMRATLLAVANGTADGLTADAVALGRSWGFSPDAARAPATLWHGDRDESIPPAFSRALAGRLGSARLELRSGVGHFGWLRHARTILGDVTAG